MKAAASAVRVRKVIWDFLSVEDGPGGSLPPPAPRRLQPPSIGSKPDAPAKAEPRLILRTVHSVLCLEAQAVAVPKRVLGDQPGVIVLGEIRGDLQARRHAHVVVLGPFVDRPDEQQPDDNVASGLPILLIVILRVAVIASGRSFPMAVVAIQPAAVGEEDRRPKQSSDGRDYGQSLHIRSPFR